MVRGGGTRPRWPGPATWASPSPLMGEARPRRLLSRSDLLLQSPLLRPVLGGGPQQVLGVSPHLLVQTAHEWRARLLGGCPPPPLAGVLPHSPPSPPAPPAPRGDLLNSVCLRRTACREGGRGMGQDPRQRGGGDTPRATAHAIHARSEPGDGDTPPRPVEDPLPDARRRGAEGGGAGVTVGMGDGGGAPPPLGGRGILHGFRDRNP